MKGASEIILNCCSHYITFDGVKEKLNDALKRNIE
jgi:hypothetical protein